MDTTWGMLYVDAHVRQHWYDKYTEATAFMESRRNDRGVLIEVAAQHPLIGGTEPGEDFSCRLRRGAELYAAFLGEDRTVEIYVPGSKHVHAGVADRVSLSEAGGRYLQAAGVPRESIRGDDLNEFYKGARGVYSSADECFVAASYFRDRNFGLLASVVLPQQMLRKTLHYIEFGVIPLIYTAPNVRGYPNYLDELFYRIPQVLVVDRTLQDPESSEAERLRKERMP